MEGSPHINVPHIDTQDLHFDPSTKLPDHFQELKKMADQARIKADPMMKEVMGLMDNIVLRTAALPQPE